jgi:GNAT superfamily N-acetyltransferase
MAQASNAAPLTIRPAVLADASQLAPLAGQLGYTATTEEVRARLVEILQDANHIVLVAERNGSGIAGYIELFPFRTLTAGARVEFGGLVVDEACRSQGIGRLLMERAQDWARVHGYKEARLRSNVIRAEAHRFYESLGYRVNKTQKSFLKTL